jgi:hypothetical protein
MHNLQVQQEIQTKPCSFCSSNLQQPLQLQAFSLGFACLAADLAIFAKKGMQ